MISGFADMTRLCRFWLCLLRVQVIVHYRRRRNINAQYAVLQTNVPITYNYNIDLSGQSGRRLG